MTPSLLVIAGPTASGKTDLALRVAEQLDGEIVNADSQQVYRHFDIGTAKPSAAELSRVPHHLVSFVDPLEPDFSAARWARRADEVIQDLHSRGKKVVLVGGTGLYLRVLLHGVVAAPARDEALRAEWEALADREGENALHAKLRAVDPASAERLHPADRVRVIRALEIHTLSGKSASEHRAEHAFAPDRYPYRMVVLTPDRAALYEAINRRTRAMYETGLVNETRALVERGYRSAAPMRAVGYAEALQVVDGTLTEAKAIELTAQSTRHYAKRQFTWFKKERGAIAVDPKDGLRVALG